MNILNNAYSAEWLLNIACESFVILFLGWGFVRLFKSKSAPLRSAVIILTMLLLLILPTTHILYPSLKHVHFGPTISLKQTLPANSQALFRDIPNQRSAQNPVFSSELPNTPAKINRFNMSWIQIINLLGILWGAGTFLFILRLFFGAMSLRKIKKGLIQVDDPRIAEVLNESANVFPHPIETRIYETPRVRSPLVIGFYKPVILLPSESFKRLNVNDIRSILTHELSHIYHKDQVIGVLQRLNKILNWWNPLIHKLSNILSRAREEISDNHVLLRNNSKEYAECLVNLAEEKSFSNRFSIATAMASSHIPLKERVNLILSKERNMETRLRKSNVWVLALVFALLFGLITSYRMSFAVDSIQEEQTNKEQAVRVKGDVKPPKVIKSVEPEYPEEARKEGIEGSVTLEATTDKFGVVIDVKVLRSIPALDKAAIDAVKQWLFEPMEIDGEPKGVIFTVTCRFSLEDEAENEVRKIGIRSGVAHGVEGGVGGGVGNGVEGKVGEGVAIGIQGEIEKGVLVLEEDNAPEPIKKVDPTYPDSAKREGIQGEVILQVIVDVYGRVEKVALIKSIPELDAAAVDAVKQWIYAPYLLNGQPVKVAFKVPIHFRLR